MQKRVGGWHWGTNVDVFAVIVNNASLSFFYSSLQAV